MLRKINWKACVRSKRSIQVYTDKWNCMQIKIEHQDSHETVSKKLEGLLENANKQGNIAVWLTSKNNTIELNSELIPEAFKLGFKFQVAHDNDFVLYKWLVDGKLSTLPPPLTHQLGVNVVVFNNKNEILMIKDKGTAKFYARDIF